MKLDKDYWEVYRKAFGNKKLSEDDSNRISGLYECEGRETFYAAAKQKKIIPAISMLMCNIGIDKEYWEPIARQYRERNEQVVECLDRVYSILHKNGVEKIVLVENFGALLAAGADLAMFGSGDADNFADMSEKDRIYEVLQREGYTINEVYSGNLLVSSSIRNESLFPKGFYFGINWDITCRVNLPCLSARGTVVDWNRCRDYQDTSIRLPSSEALMYICLMHIAVHGFCKAPDVRLYYDIANAAVGQPDWSQIAAWARRDKNCVKIAAAAYLSNRLLEIPIPDDIFHLGKKSQMKKLLFGVYDKEKKLLKVQPRSIRSLWIEACSDDQSFLHGLFRILFPGRIWLEKKYGSWITGNIKHFADIL